MALSKVSLSDDDIKLLIRKKKGNKNVRLLVLLFSILVLFIIYTSVGFDTSNETFKFFKIVVIIVISALILSTLIDANFDNDLKEKQKFVGNIKVKKKEFWHNIEDNIDHYIIIFDEWQVGQKYVKREFWNETNESDEFYVEVAMNSGYVLKFTKNNIDVVNALRVQQSSNIIESTT